MNTHQPSLKTATHEKLAEQNALPTTDVSRDVQICLNKIVLDNPDQNLIVTWKTLDELPVSKYRPEGYLEALTPHYEVPHTEKYDTDATMAYSSSDETILYWPLDTTSQIHMFPSIMFQSNIEQKPT